MTEPAKPPSLGDVVGAATFVIGLVTAWLYVAGWTYAYTYFDQFRIPLLLADLPREHLFVYGGLTVWKNAGWAAVIALVAAAVAGIGIWKRDVLGRSWLVALTVAGTLLLFALARVAGINTAVADAAAQRESDYGAYPRVLLDFDPESDLSDAQKAASGGCARLILATKERLFLIVPRRDAPALELSTIAIPWAGTRAATVSGHYTSCP